MRQCPPLMMTPADTDLRVALSPLQSVCFQLTTLLPAEPTTCLRLPNEVSSHPFDRFHVAHSSLCHRITYPHWRKLEIWSILRQVTDSRHECSVPCDVTLCECLAVGVIVICHLRSVPVDTVVPVIPLVLRLGLHLSTSALSPCLHPYSPRHMVSQSDSLAPTQNLSVSP